VLRDRARGTRRGPTPSPFSVPAPPPESGRGRPYAFPIIAQPPFTSGQLDHLAKIVGESTTGSELDRLLAEARLPASAMSTKWRRLRDSFEQVQRRDGTGNGVARFVKLTLAPDRFFGARETHEALCAEANAVLSFAGLELRSNGALVRVRAARTLAEAEQRADRLKAKLRARDVHPDVLHFCRAELEVVPAVVEVRGGGQVIS